MSDRFYSFICTCGFTTWSVKETAICPKCGALNQCVIEEDDPKWGELLGRKPKGGVKNDQGRKTVLSKGGSQISKRGHERIPPTGKYGHAD